MSRLQPEEAGRRALLALLLAVLAAAVLTAILVPFHATDALIYGSWSKQIAATGHFRFANLDSGQLHRPLVYAVQGYAWWLVGVHEWIGRLWMLAFGVLAFWATGRLARSLVPGVDESGARLVGAMAMVLALAVPDIAQLGFSGLTDVPVAALCGLVAVLLWTGPQATFRRADETVSVLVERAPWYSAALVAAGAAAMLAKPSALPALVGIGVIHLVVGPRAGAVQRLLRGCLPLAAGVVLALVYGAIEAHALHLSLNGFLSGVTTKGAGVDQPRVDAYYAVLNSDARRHLVPALGWLGPYVMLPLILGLLYATLRVVGVEHRRAMAFGAPAAIVATIVLPVLANPDGGLGQGALDPDSPLAILFTIASALIAFAGARADDEHVPDRAQLARLLGWIAVLVAVWFVKAPYNTRYLGPAWPAMLALCAVVLLPGIRALATRHAALGLGAVAAVALAGVADLRNFDALGSQPSGKASAFTALRHTDPGDLTHPERMRAIADEQLGGALAGLRPRMAGGPGPLVTSDGRFAFFFGVLRVRRVGASACSQLTGARAFATFTVTGQSDADTLTGERADPAFWTACRAPRVRVLAAAPGSYELYAVG